MSAILESYLHYNNNNNIVYNDADNVVLTEDGFTYIYIYIYIYIYRDNGGRPDRNFETKWS